MDSFCQHYMSFGTGYTDNLCADKNTKKKKKLYTRVQIRCKKNI